MQKKWTQKKHVGSSSIPFSKVGNTHSRCKIAFIASTTYFSNNKYAEFVKMYQKNEAKKTHQRYKLRYSKSI